MWPFLAANLAVWIIMTAILVVVPDSLESWLGLEVARVVGWTVAASVWVVAVEQQWKARFGTVTRFLLRLALWLSSAFVALWISEQFRM
jgi:hypothetical protein